MARPTPTIESETRATVAAESTPNGNDLMTLGAAHVPRAARSRALGKASAKDSVALFLAMVPVLAAPVMAMAADSFPAMAMAATAPAVGFDLEQATVPAMADPTQEPSTPMRPMVTAICDPEFPTVSSSTEDSAHEKSITEGMRAKKQLDRLPNWPIAAHAFHRVDRLPLELHRIRFGQPLVAPLYPDDLDLVEEKQPHPAAAVNSIHSAAKT